MLIRLIPACIVLLGGSISPIGLAQIAERPVTGGLGVEFKATLTPTQLGSEVSPPPELQRADNHTLREEPVMVPGQVYPWRYYLTPKLPRLFRKYPAQSYVMLDENGLVMRVVSVVELTGCGPDHEWLTRTVAKKYAVDGDMAIDAPNDFEKAFRVTFSQKQIDVRCGPKTVLDYADYAQLDAWAKRQKGRAALARRQASSLEKRQLVLARKRALRYADEFTLGDRFKLLGAFGIAFNQPFAKNSTQNLPTDRPFIAVLPNLPRGFDGGEIKLELAPNRNPIVIRGEFTTLDFTRVADALKAKYGTPMKSTERHVIHKVSGNHAIVKKLPNGAVELAFIDTKAKADQRQRLWEQESEGV